MPRSAGADRRLLGSAAAAYGGHLLEEDLYEYWADPLREEVKAVYVQVARAPADDASANGVYDIAVRHVLQILECDPVLLRAGRHGEARALLPGLLRADERDRDRSCSFPDG
jgi:DNA-binding SARP family transcriptional activator